MSDDPSTGTYTTDQLRNLLTLWQQPGGWCAGPTPSPSRLERDTDRGARRAEGATRRDRQVADATPLAPNERRGHNSLIDWIRSFFGRR